MKDIVVYVDQGVSGESLRQTVKSLQQEVDFSAHSLKRMDAAALLSEKWENRTSLFIMPGGRDVYYHSALEGMGTAKIRHFVEMGGHYLGLCAGAYFAAAAIEFEKGGQLQVCGKRSLGFYPGVAVGPAYGLGKYSYENEQGACAAQIDWEQEGCFAYFNGGCYFEAPHNHSHIEVLSSYVDLADKPAAIIRCAIGKGEALLSGVHIEFSPQHLRKGDKYIEKFLPQLKEADAQRRAIFRQVLARAGLKLKPTNV